MARSELAYIGHPTALKDDLTAEENLRLSLELAGTPKVSLAVRDALVRAGLAAQQRLAAKRLSQGQKRRVHLARLLLSRQTLWLLDEPATALDSEGLALLCATVSEHVAHGGIAIMATHQDLPIAASNPRELSL